MGARIKGLADCDLRHERVSASDRLCENVKVPGFRVSIHPSWVAAKPIQRDLKGRCFSTSNSSRVFTHPRPTADNYGSRPNVR
jgi:hypothetical protein